MALKGNKFNQLQINIAGRAQDRESSLAQDRRSTTVPHHQHCERKGIWPIKTCTTYSQGFLLEHVMENSRGLPAKLGSPGKWKRWQGIPLKSRNTRTMSLWPASTATCNGVCFITLLSSPADNVVWMFALAPASSNERTRLARPWRQAICSGVSP